MRVLLVSPVDPKVPSNLKFLMGGENTYTKTLLSNPPPGVTYVHHADALESGAIRLGPLHRPLGMLVKFRVLPLSAGTMDLVVLTKFDLVHCHAYTLRLTGEQSHVPVVLGDSIPSWWGLSNYFHQGRARIAATFAVRKLIHGALSIYDQDLMLGDFSRLITMSRFSQRKHVSFGSDARRITVIHPGLVDRRRGKTQRAGPVRILFAGVWFERKGGMILWEAYQNVRKRFGQKVQLTILGPLPYKLQVTRNKLQEMDTVQHDFVPYDRLVGEFYPSADIFVHVPPKAEGYGLVVEEAMSFGIPVIASNVGAVPEMVENNVTGLLVRPNSVNSLSAALERLIKKKVLRERLGAAARERFLEQFSLPVMHKKLLEVYEEALRNFPIP